jgi:CheY-like chemotaxis protein
MNNPVRVMIVEDSTDYRNLLGRLIRKEGYEVSMAGHGGEALDQLETESVLPSLILLDLMMPFMDGFEFRERQLQNPRTANIPVILLTAHGNLEADPVRLRIQHWLRKPVEKAQLVSLVKSVLG